MQKFAESIRFIKEDSCVIGLSSIMVIKKCVPTEDEGEKSI